MTTNGMMTNELTTNASDTTISNGKSNITSEVPVELQLIAAGCCRHPEFLTLSGGTLRPVQFPAGLACILHPIHGYILFDTGYSARFFEETKRLPESLYRWVTPVTFRTEDSAVSRLHAQGIKAEDIQYVVLSHLHADHIAGLRDFPNARIVLKREAHAAVKGLGPFASIKAGYLPGLLPDDFENRALFIEDTPGRELPGDFPFMTGYDLLGDGSMIAVDLPGHAAGQIGLFLKTATEEVFLCADAVWSSRAYREHRMPHAAAGLIMADRRRYADSFERVCLLHQRYPHIRIIPSHCREVFIQRTGEGES